MKRRKPPHKAEPAAAAAGEEEAEEAAMADDEQTGDICEALLLRYGKSSAPQHRHLCASACAMRSVLSDEGLPPTPAAYFAAVLTSLPDADAAHLPALSSFLSVLLPRVPAASLPLPTLKNAVLSTLLPLLRSHQLPSAALRPLLSALALLLPRLDDWPSAEPPLRALLHFALDGRPKVRKTAQSCVQQSFSHLRATALGRNFRKLVVSMFRSRLSSADPETPYILQLVKLLTPHLPRKNLAELLPELCSIVTSSPTSRPSALSLLKALLQRVRADDLASEADKLINSLTSCISAVDGPDIPSEGIVILVSSLFRNTLDRICPINPSLCNSSLPAVFSSLVDYLSSESDSIAQYVSMVLKELISCHIHQGMFQNAAHSSSEAFPETIAVQTLSGLLEKKICSCSGVPKQYLLSVVSCLFIKLGASSVQSMANTILDLGWRMGYVSPDIDHLRACLGSAIIAVGPEKMLDLLPISLDEERMICSNSWLIPLLRRNVSGASLQFFIKHIVPLATYLKKKCKKARRSSAPAGDIQLLIRELWDLLPAFCHYPKDMPESFGSLAEVLVGSLKEDASLHKTIALSLQVLVLENKRVLHVGNDRDNTNKMRDTASDLLNDLGLRDTQCCYSTEDASKNMKALLSCSVDLFDALVSAFCNSPQENHQYLKGAIECFAPLVGTSHLRSIVNTSLENFELENDVEDLVSSVDEGKKNAGKDDQKAMMMELVSCFVVGAKKSLLSKIYDYMKPFLHKKEGSCSCEAYLVLFKILKEHPSFISERLDDLLSLLIGKKPSEINSLRIHLLCLQQLLVYLIKSDVEEEEEKAFLILNEIILTLKDSSNDVRESAYDLLFGVLGSFKDYKLNFPGSPLHRLLAMITAYFSSSSPQITSGAIAALSLLVYKDASICIYEPSLLPSILALLRKKDSEIIKASLGFVKVLVSSLGVIELNKLLPNIVDGILPWSSVSKNHFRTKVKVIFEIMMRRCGANAINMVVPEKYKGFIRTIEDYRKRKPGSKETGSSDDKKPSEDSKLKGDKKRKHKYNASSDKKHSASLKKSHEHKRQKNSTPFSVQRTKQTAGNVRKRQQTGGTSFPKDKTQSFGYMGKGKYGNTSQQRKAVGRENNKMGNKRKRHSSAKRTS